MWRAGEQLRAVCSIPDICLPRALHMSQNPEVLPFCRTARLLSSEVAYMNRTEKLREWVFPAMLILFILQVILLPVMIGLTYAVPAERPEHILTYRTGSLAWDKATSVRPDGSAELSFFETLYKNVNADNAEKVLAPGTEKDSVVRLKNDTNKEITYTAVLYSLSTSPDLDIGATLSGDGFSDTDRYALPKSIKKEAVIRAVGGKLDAKKLQDFDINWFWNFEDGANTDGRDAIDTYLGNKAANGKADEATLGFYLVVYDGSEVLPIPGTGDDTMIGGYVVLMLISGGMCLLTALTRKRRGKGED